MTRPDDTGTPHVIAADPLTLVVGVHLVLTDRGTVLLGLRRNTSYAAGLWHLPAGHMEPGEPVTRSMTREAEEELGILIAEDDLTLVHTLHHLDTDHGRLQLFFRPARHTGQIRNAEPHKCEELRWWPLNRLPADTVPYTVHALGEIARGNPLSTVGRPTPPQPPARTVPHRPDRPDRPAPTA